MEALHLLPGAADRAVPLLVSKLKHEDSKVRRIAARTLGNISVSDRAVIASLVEAIYDSDPWVWSEVTESLYALAVSKNGRTIYSFADKNASNPDVRRKLCEALGNLGPAATRGEPWLIDALNDEDELVRWSAALALTKVGVTDQRAVVPLLQVFREPDPQFVYFRWRVGVLLHSLKVDENELVPVLIADLAHENPYPRLVVAKALWREFGQLEVALPTVIELLKHDNVEIKTLAAQLLGRIGPEARMAIPGLSVASTDSDEVVRMAAQQAIENVGRRSD
jgi:HEAT repeat protein